MAGSAGELNHLSLGDSYQIAKIFTYEGLGHLDTRLDLYWCLLGILGLGSEDDTSHRNPCRISHTSAWRVAGTGPSDVGLGSASSAPLSWVGCRLTWMTLSSGTPVSAPLHTST